MSKIDHTFLLTTTEDIKSQEHIVVLQNVKGQEEYLHGIWLATLSCDAKTAELLRKVLQMAFDAVSQNEMFLSNEDEAK
jgi:hypothetical protein